MDEKQEEQHESNVQSAMLEQALDEEKKRSEDYLTRLKYAQADLENLKKRCDRQIEEVSKFSNERLVVELLGVVDELEMAIQSCSTPNSSETVIQGVEMTLKKLRKILENEGVHPIDCLGKPFDPAKHNAIAKTEEEDAEECTIVQEVRKGYAMREKVIRPSIVKIVVKPSKSQMEMNPDE
jgi:molecular chaperone GrpE